MGTRSPICWVRYDRLMFGVSSRCAWLLCRDTSVSKEQGSGVGSGIVLSSLPVPMSNEASRHVVELIRRLLAFLVGPLGVTVGAFVMRLDVRGYPFVSTLCELWC